MTAGEHSLLILGSPIALMERISQRMLSGLLSILGTFWGLNKRFYNYILSFIFRPCFLPGSWILSLPRSHFLILALFAIKGGWKWEIVLLFVNSKTPGFFRLHVLFFRLSYILLQAMGRNQGVLATVRLEISLTGPSNSLGAFFRFQHYYRWYKISCH